MPILGEQKSEETTKLVPPNLIAPIPPPPQQDFFRFRIDATDILEEVQHQLKGEMFVPNPDGRSGEWVSKFGKWINEEGLNTITFVMYSCGINKNTFLGNLTLDQINFKCRMIKRKLALLLVRKYKDYEVKKEMRDLLITTVVNTIHSALSRSEGGLEADQISTATQRHEIYQNQNQQEREGVLKKISPLRLFRR